MPAWCARKRGIISALDCRHLEDALAELPSRYRFLVFQAAAMFDSGPLSSCEATRRRPSHRARRCADDPVPICIFPAAV
jgi:hypothetical protein